jgi:hypothetical protein
MDAIKAESRCQLETGYRGRRTVRVSSPLAELLPASERREEPLFSISVTPADASAHILPARHRGQP